jgi:uncharacterized LabA/DUF88 family protein
VNRKRQTNIYVDGFNLYYGCLKDTPYRWLDLWALSKRLFPRDRIGRIRYCTAIVDARDDPQQPQRQQTYIRALETIPNLSVHYGSFRTDERRLLLVKPPKIGSKFAKVWKTEEKGSDVNLASYLLLDTFKGDCTTAVVISNDADLKKPIEIAMQEGVKVGVVNPHPAKRRSRDLKSTFFKQIRESALRQCQFPPTLQDSRGTIHKPPTW